MKYGGFEPKITSLIILDNMYWSPALGQVWCLNTYDLNGYPKRFDKFYPFFLTYVFTT